MLTTSGAQPKSSSRIERLSRFFREHPHQWFDGARELAAIGGRYAWRSRVSDCRRKYGYDIQNRQRSVKRPDGTSYTVSEYRYTPLDWSTGEQTATGALTPVSG
jgi:hypothetical protein